MTRKPFKYDRVVMVHGGAKHGGYKFPAEQAWLFSGRRVTVRFNWRP